MQRTVNWPKGVSRVLWTFEDALNQTYYSSPTERMSGYADILVALHFRVGSGLQPAIPEIAIVLASLKIEIPRAVYCVKLSTRELVCKNHE